LYAITDTGYNTDTDKYSKNDIIDCNHKCCCRTHVCMRSAGAT
jgi:hypothetical protein